MMQEFGAFFKKATIQGEKVEMLLSALSEAEGVFDACRMSGKTVIVTLEDIQQELPLSDEVDEAEEHEGMDELPLGKPQPSVTINNIYMNPETGEVEAERDEGHMLPGDGDWEDTDAYDAEVAEIDMGEVTPGNTERVYTDEPIPGREEGEVE